MGYQDCPCFKCDHGGEREKTVECPKRVYWIYCMEVHTGDQTEKEIR